MGDTSEEIKKETIYWDTIKSPVEESKLGMSTYNRFSKLSFGNSETELKEIAEWRKCVESYTRILMGIEEANTMGHAIISFMNDHWKSHNKNMLENAKTVQKLIRR